MDREEYLRLANDICLKLTERHPINIVSSSYEGRKNAENTEKAWTSSIRDFNFEGEPVRLRKKVDDDRFWVDFAFEYRGEFFPVNFKSGAGRTADNVSGLKYIRYLIFYDADAGFDVPGISEEDLAKKIVSLANGQARLDTRNRDYFCIAHCTETESIRVVPIGCIRPEDLVTNPKNLFQVNFNKAHIERRNLHEMVSFIIGKFIEYQEKRAKPFLIFKDAGFDSRTVFDLRS